MTEFGNMLRTKRRESGISQRQLAESVGVDFSYISKLENSRLAPPAADTIVRIAQAIGCTQEDLLAAAKKVPRDVGKTLAAQPGAQKFLQEAIHLGLSQAEWEEMLGKLRSLRSDE
jgi:transcriptional regulator with XRE-family HTH domain